MNVIAENLRARASWDHDEIKITAAAEIDRLEAERDRLRDALERVLANPHFNDSADILTPLDILRTETRAALTGDTP